MRDAVIIRHDDFFLSLVALSKVSGLSPRKLRTLLADPVAALPHYRPGGKILVRWSHFVTYMERFRARPSGDIEQTVQEIVDGLKGKRPRGTRGVRHPPPTQVP